MIREHLDVCPYSGKREHVVVDVSSDPSKVVCDNNECARNQSADCVVKQMYPRVK